MKLIEMLCEMVDISIHAPREGRDGRFTKNKTNLRYFNPRAPRGARPGGAVRGLQIQLHFNPRAPRGARLSERLLAVERGKFQSTRPARGATDERAGAPLARMPFQSTRPARGATAGHSRRRRLDEHFNPRAPRGARLTAPVEMDELPFISIHAPREGRDELVLQFIHCALNFNPRAPRGARPRPAEHEQPH